MDITGRLHPAVAEFLNDVAQKELAGVEEWWTTTSIAGLLLSSEIVYSEIGTRGYWYDNKKVIVKVGGRLIGYDWFHFTAERVSEADAREIGLTFDLSSVAFYEEYEATVKRYRKVLPTEK